MIKRIKMNKMIKMIKMIKMKNKTQAKNFHRLFCIFHKMYKLKIYCKLYYYNFNVN